MALKIAVRSSLLALTCFAGWSILAHGSQLTSSAPAWTVTYEGNGDTAGAVPVDSGKYAAGAVVTVKGNTGSLVRAGYSFSGWNTAANGAGVAHAPGSTLIVGSAIRAVSN